MAKEAKQESAPQKREMKTVETQRGEVVVFEAAGETLTGLLTQKPGRTVGEDETPTVEIFNPETGKLKLLILSTVLQNKIDTINQKATDFWYVEVTYKGKTEGKERSYHDYEVKYGEATQDELNALQEFEAAHI